MYRDFASHRWTEDEILSLAAGVESNTNHPLGKAIVEASRSANCHNMKVISLQTHFIYIVWSQLMYSLTAHTREDVTLSSIRGLSWLDRKPNHLTHHIQVEAYSLRLI